MHWWFVEPIDIDHARVDGGIREVTGGRHVGFDPYFVAYPDVRGSTLCDARRAHKEARGDPWRHRAPLSRRFSIHPIRDAWMVTG